MNFEECISLSMLGINNFLESGRVLNTDNNFNDYIISLDSDGFIMTEKSVFDGELEFDGKALISPIFLLEVLFNGNGYGKKDMITSHIRKISDSEYRNSISYYRLVNLIENMRKNSNNMDNNIVDFNYLYLEKMLNNIKPDNYNSLKNQVLKLKEYSYDDIVNLSLTNPSLSRKIERMYQTELLLRKYSVMGIYDTRENVSKSIIDKTDFSKYRVDWKDFTSMVRACDKLEENYFDCNFNIYDKRFTVLGLEDLELPSYPVDASYIESSKVKYKK